MTFRETLKKPETGSWPTAAALEEGREARSERDEESIAGRTAHFASTALGNRAALRHGTGLG